MRGLMRGDSQLFRQRLTACDAMLCQVCLKNSRLIFYWDSTTCGIIADAYFRELALLVQAGQI